MFSTANPFQAIIRNEAGGRAYERDPQEALAQFAVTGMLDNTAYLTGEQQLDTLLTVARQVSPEFLAKTLVYARDKAYMKETPALLLALLATRDSYWFHLAAPHVLTNGRMVRNFFRVIRSGKVGRRGFAGNGILRKAVSAWINSESAQGLLYASVGNDPTLRDIIRLVRPHPISDEQSAILRYFTRGEVVADTPEIIQRYEQLKRLVEDGVDPSLDMLRGLPFEKLTSLPLTPAVWKQLARQASWTQTRMHLNAFAKHGVYDEKPLVHELAAKLLTRKPNQLFPYQMFNTLEHLDPAVPSELRMALEALLEQGSILDGFPRSFPDTLLLLDTSGSMKHIVNTRSVVTFMQIAALFAAVILRNSEQATVYGFNAQARELQLGKSALISELTHSLSWLANGGTDLAQGFILANQNHLKAKLVVVLSDNQSWAGDQSGPHTPAMMQWQLYKQRVPDAKLALIDIAPSVSTQVRTDNDVINIAGYGDAVFTMLTEFWRENQTTWINTIYKTAL
jgi:60 kDa SS-A/Ro ribonucleoprotein